MAELHEALAELATDHGQAVFDDAAAFRGVLDDYLDEDIASRGTIHLLSDAVGLGSLQSTLSMIASGATPERAVDTAGRRLARDRGSADVLGSQWACALLGYAVGEVPLDLVRRLDPEGGHQPAGYGVPPLGPPSLPPPGAPGQAAGEAGEHTRVVPRPAARSTGPSAPAPEHPTPAGPPRSRRPTVLVAGVAVAVLALLTGGIAGILAMTGDDDEPADAPRSAAPGESSGTHDRPTSYADGVTIAGADYAYNLPEGWTEGTDQIPRSKETDAIDTAAFWGPDAESARANIIVERSPAAGDEEQAADRWRATLGSVTGATPATIADTTIDGAEGTGVRLDYANRHDVPIRQIAYLVVRDDLQYSIAVTVVGADDRAERIFRDALASWQWTS